MRGENHLLTSTADGAAGSPPHARGKRHHLPLRTDHARITPACAGKTLGASGSLTGRTDHPRMRGENA